MLKYHFIDNSLPLSQRIYTFWNFDDLMEVVGKDRTIEKIKMNRFIGFDYNPALEIFKITGDMDRKNAQTPASRETIECPAYAFDQLSSNILKMGNVFPLIETSYKVDLEMAKLVTVGGWGAGFVGNHAYSSIRKLNEIMRNIWKISRTLKKRTADVYIYRVKDAFTTAKDGDGRCIVTGRYIHSPDIEIITMVYDEAKKANPNLRFTSGRVSPLMTSASFVDNSYVKLDNTKDALLGIYCQNSEFKYSSVFLKGYLFLPDYGTEFIGSTYRLSASIKHVGDTKIFNEKIKRAIKTILGKNQEILDLFKGLKKYENRAEAIDFEDEVDGKNYLSLELGMSKKIDDLIEIQKTKSYPKNIEGVVMTLMDYGTNYAKTDSERDSVNDKIETILRKPDTFIRDVQEMTTRADVVDF